MNHTHTLSLLRFVPLLLCPAHSALAADDFGGSSFYYGDLHVHTGISGDGTSKDYGHPCLPKTEGPCGAITNFVKIAKSNSLDFASITDHVNGAASTEDAELFHSVQLSFMNQNDPENGFITLPGTELWFQQAGNSKVSGGEVYGHKNMYFFADNEKLATLTLTASQFNKDDGTATRVADCDEIWTIVEEMEKSFGDILLLPHHPAGHGPLNTAWACHNPTHTPSAEVYSQHGNSMQLNPDFDPLGAPGSYKEGGSIDNAIHPALHGYKLGFFSSTDNHSTIPGGVCSLDNTDYAMRYGGGLAVVMLDTATSFTRQSIFKALVDRKTYATSGPMLPVKVTYAVAGEVYGEMGDILSIPSGQTIDMTLRIPEDYVAHVTHITVRQPDMTSGEKGLWFETEMSYAAHGTWTASFTDPPPVLYPTIHIDGDSWYGKGKCNDGGANNLEMGWVSPTWFDTTSDTDGTDTGTEPETQSTNDTSPSDTETGLHTDGKSSACSGCAANTFPLSLAHLVLLIPVVFVLRRSKDTIEA